MPGLFVLKRLAMYRCLMKTDVEENLPRLAQNNSLEIGYLHVCSYPVWSKMSSYSLRKQGTVLAGMQRG